MQLDVRCSPLTPKYLMCQRRVVYTILLAFSLTSILHAQNYLTSTGTSDFSVPEPAESGIVDAATGNLHLEIPLGSFPQRGGSAPLVPKLIYDSHIWTFPTDGSSKVWTTQGALFGLAFGTWGFHEGGSAGLFRMAASGQGCNVDYMLWSDAGVQHYFNIPGTWNGSQCSGGSSFAADASGYKFVQSAWSSSAPATVSVFAPDGTEVWGSDLYNIGVAAKDSNGNYLGLTVANSLPPGVLNPLLDTIGRKVVNQSTTNNVTSLQVINSQGSTSNYTVTTAIIPVKTNFKQSGVTECTSNCTATVIQTIGLPDGTSYSFLYDCDSTTGNTACNSPGGQTAYYGTLTQMTLPTSGSVTYGYTIFKDAAGGISQWLTSKSSSASCCWAYTPTVINSGLQQQVTVSKPDGSKETITSTLDSSGTTWPTQISTYDTDGVTLLSTVLNTWYFDTGCTLNVCQGQGHQDVRKLRATITLPVPNGNITKTTTYAYDSPQTGNLTQLKEWKYLNGTAPTFPSVPDRATYLTYATIGANNNINRPLTVTICNNTGTDSDCPGGGSKTTKTTITYDAYGSNNSLALTNIAGVINHDDTHFGTGYTTRGNPTQVSRWVSGSTYVTTSLSYDITGQIIKTVDPALNGTTYSFADKFYDDNGADPPTTRTLTAATNAYVTQITDPIGSMSAGYYFGSGKTALVTDYNTQTTYNHFVDSLERPTETDYPIGWTIAQYHLPVQGITEIDSFAAIGDTTASVNCVSCTHSQVQLDSFGRLTAGNLVNNPAGAVSVSTNYDQLSRISSSSHPHIGTSDPNYVFESIAYDGLGRKLKATHPDGLAARSAYGAAVSNSGGVITQQGSTSTYGYAFPLLDIDEAGRQRQEWIDGFGHVVEVDEPSTGASTYYGSVTIGGNEQSYTYYPCGTSSCPTTVYDTGSVSITVNGFTASVGYNQGDSMVSVASALANVLNGNSSSPVTASTSTGPGCFPGWTCIVNLTTKSSVTTAYPLSTAASSNDPTHFPTPSFSGTAQSPYLHPAITSPYVTLYSYDALGNLTQVVQGAQTRTYQYDGLSRLTKEITAESGTITLSYLTSLGALCSGNPSNPCSKTDARGITTTYTYDAANRLKQKTHSDSTGSVTYAYDSIAYAKGRLVSVTDPSGTESYIYDRAGRISSTNKIIGGTTYTIGYAYNTGAQLVKIIYPSGRVVHYSYDNVGHLCVVAPQTTNCSAYTTPFLTIPSLQYDASGRPLTATYGNGVIATAAYTAQTFQLNSLIYTKGSTTLFGLNYFYKYDSANCPTGSSSGNDGQIQCIIDTVQPGRSERYTYDALGRLSTSNTLGSASYPAWGLSETYDRYGNRTAQAVTAGSGYNVSLSINSANNQISGYTYDASGNITAYPSNAATFSYDGEECNTSYVGNGSNASYTCDANHLRVKKVVTGTNAVSTVYVRSGGNIIAEYDNGATVTSPTREYIYGHRVLAYVTNSSGGTGGTIAYEHGDHLSPRLFTDAAGNNVGEQGTYTFGESWYNNSATKSWVFTSYERDLESGNDYALARQYASTQGRFLSPDRLQGHVGDPQSWNRYSYVENDPVDVSDPNGQGFWEDLGFAIADVLLAVIPGAQAALPYALGAEGAAVTASEAEKLAQAAVTYTITSCVLLGSTEPCNLTHQGGTPSGQSPSTGGPARGTEGAPSGDPGVQSPGNGGAGTSDPSPAPGGSTGSQDDDVAVGIDIFHCVGCGAIWRGADNAVKGLSAGYATVFALGAVAPVVVPAAANGVGYTIGYAQGFYATGGVLLGKWFTANENYIIDAKEMGLDYFSLGKGYNVLDYLGDAWIANKGFLDAVLARGLPIYLNSPPVGVAGGYGRELEYIFDAGVPNAALFPVW